MKPAIWSVTDEAAVSAERQACLDRYLGKKLASSIFSQRDRLTPKAWRAFADAELMKAVPAQQAAARDELNRLRGMKL